MLLLHLIKTSCSRAPKLEGSSKIGGESLPAKRCLDKALQLGQTLQLAALFEATERPPY